MVAAGAVLIAFALIWPTLKGNQISNATLASITPITPKTYAATVDGAHLGDPNALVKMDVWEDFQCPACARYSQITAPLVIQNYVETGVVYYTFHFWPFIDGGNPTGESHQAANAAMCASEQGRFWDYHDILFVNWSGENQGAFMNPRLIAFAQTLGLNMTDFNKCFDANPYKAIIEQDFADGQAKDVTSTPSIFVDGVMVLVSQNPKLVPTYEYIAAAIEAALAGK
jgi:protein-disulfide isomerase